MSQNLVFHHIGKPVALNVIRDDPNTRYSPLFDMYTLDIPHELAIHIQLHAFGEASSLHPDIREHNHVAFTVGDIENALVGHEILMPLYQPFRGYRCAMVRVNHQLIELIETTLSEEEIWGGASFRNSALYPGQD